MAELTVFRSHFSPYFSKNFPNEEKRILSEITGVEFLNGNSEKKAKILITNTHSELEGLSDLRRIGPISPEELRLLVHPNSGYDNFSPEFIQESPFPIVLGNPIRAKAVAHYALGCLFEFFNSPPWVKTWEPSRNWGRSPLFESEGIIIGHGEIGKILSSSLSPLVRKLHIVDPFKGKLPSLDDAPLENCQFLILACGLNSKTKGLINKKVLERLPSSFCLINPARGKLINQKELFEFIINAPGVHAYLDVFEKEPAPFESFPHTPNLKLSCHVAGVFRGLDLAIIEYEKKVIVDFINLGEEKFRSQYAEIILQNRLVQGETI